MTKIDNSTYSISPHFSAIPQKGKNQDCCIIRIVKNIFQAIADLFACIFCCNQKNKSSSSSYSYTPPRYSPKKQFSSVPQKTSSVSSKHIPKPQPKGPIPIPKPINSKTTAPKGPKKSPASTTKNRLKKQPLTQQPRGSKSSSQGLHSNKVKNTKTDKTIDSDKSPEPIDIIYGNANQGSQIEGANSCSFQAVMFVDAMLSQKPQEITAEFIDTILKRGNVANNTYNPSFELIEPLYIPIDNTNLQCCTNESSIYNWSIALEQALEHINFTYLIGKLIPGYSAGVITLRNESYGIVITEDSKAYLFNSHATQHGEESLATIRVFRDMPHLINFLGTHYKFIPPSQAPEIDPAIQPYVEALKSNYDILVNQNATGSEIFNAVQGFLIPNFQDTAFTHDLVNEIIAGVMTEKDALANRARDLTINQITLTPYRLFP